MGAQIFFSGNTLNSELYDISVTSYAHYKGKGSQVMSTLRMGLF